MSSFALPKQLPSPAFGDGSHPTTLLCARAVDLLCRQHSPRAVLDVGTGTGVLARIARARGASFVVGTDIDPLALSSARANAALDTCSTDIMITDLPPDHWGARFDLVVANILEEVLIELAPSLKRAIAPQGLLLISGFTRLQIPKLEVSFGGLGFALISRSFSQEWALLLFRRN